MRRLWLLLIFATPMTAQNPQTQTAPLYSVNAAWVNGAAPGYAPTSGSGLTLNLGPGTVNCAATITNYAGGTLTMAASSTNYIYLNTSSSCVPATKITAFTTADVPLATVTTSGSAITAISDVRGPFSNGVGAAASVPIGGVSGLGSGVATALGNGVNTSGGVVTQPVANSSLASASTTVNSQTCTLGASCTVTASASSVTPGTTTVTSGTSNGLLYDNAGTLGNLATTNNGVLVTSGGGVPSVSTTLPSGLAMQTPASVTLTNATGLPIAGITGLGSGVATALAGAVSGTSGSLLETNGSAGSLTGFPTFNQNTTGYAAGLAGGAVGSAPYQSAANVTSFVASPTTSGHTFVYGWQPTGSALPPGAIDITAYLTSGTVTSFSAPAGSWPTWLVPTVTTSTTTPSLAVASSLTLANVAAGASPSGSYDFSGATQLKHPVTAGYTSAANGELGYDSTNLNWHGWANGLDEFFAGFSVASPPTSGHVAVFTKTSNAWSLTDGGAPGVGTVTSVATTSPITGGTFTTSGTIACATCVTSAASLTSNALMTGAGGQASQTVTTGSGVLTALGNGVNTSGGVVTQPVANTSLANSSVTIGSTNVALGATAATVAGLTLTSPTLSGTVAGSNTVPLTILAQSSANTMLGNWTGSTANVAANAMPSCTGAADALNYLSGTGVQCNSSITAAAVPVGGITGLGTGVGAALAVAVGTAGAPVVNGGALGTPSSGVITSLTGTCTSCTANSVNTALTMNNGGAGAASGTTFNGATAQTLSYNTLGAAPLASPTFTGTVTVPTLVDTGVTGPMMGNGVSAVTAATGHQLTVPTACASTTGSSSSTAYTCSTTPTFTPVNGDNILWQPGANDAANTVTGPTLNVNSLGAKTIVGNGNVAIIQGDVASGAAGLQYPLVYSTNSLAPCSGGCWQLNSGTRNSWQSTYVNANNNALKAFYACNPFTTVCRIIDNADSEHTCWLSSTCAFGPQHEQNLWQPATLSLMQRRGFPIYSTGLIGPISVVSTIDLFSNGILPGITASSGTLTQVSLSGVGPQQATGALTGGGTLQMAAGATVTIGTGSFVATPGGTAGAFNRIRVYCAINSTTGTMTVTISGQTASTACTGTNASPLAQAFTVTNTAGTTALTVGIACTTGTCNLGGWEEIYTTGNVGYAIDGFEATGGANSYWLGAATGNAAYEKLASGTVALLDVAIGINDAAGSVSSATVNTNISTFISNWPAASVLIWSSFPYTGTGSTNYPAIQAGEQQLALTNGYDFLNTADNASTNTSINYWNGIQNSDFTHPTDMGAGANDAQWWAHFNGSEAQFALTFGANTTPYQNGFISNLDGTDTSALDGNSSICWATGLTNCYNWRVVSAPAATFQSMWAGGIAATTQTASNGAVAPLGSYVQGYSTTAGTQVPAAAQFTTITDPATGLVYNPFNRVPLTASYSNATTSGTNITGWSWPILSGQTMILECNGMYQAASTGGLRFEATGPTMTGFQLSLTMGLNSTAASMASPPSVTAVSTLTSAIAVTTATTNYPFHLYVYANASAAGTLQLQGASAAAVNMTIGVGSSCVVR